MDVKYIGGDVPWTLPFGDHFYSSSQASFPDTHQNNFNSASDLETIARRHGFEPLYSTNEKKPQTTFSNSNHNSQWMNAGVLFTDKTIESDLTGIHKTDFTDDHGHTFCYLCSINQHDHDRTKPRDPSRRRKLIPYHNPKALKARPSSVDRTNQDSSNLVSYRFIVRTGTRKNSGTRAQVFLYIYGTENNWTSVNLHARTNSNSDGFPSGSIRTFCLKGPEIGQLRHLNVNIIGARSDKEWFLKEIEITNLNTSLTWLCEFNCWLPKTDEQEHYPIKPTVRRESEISFENLAVYILQIRTGGKRFAGTDSTIQVKIRGSTSQTRRLPLTSNGADLFEQNQLDTFAIVGWDIGDLLEITVDSDQSQLASDWDLKEMVMWKIMPSNDHKQVQVYFPFNAWLGKKTSTLKTKKDAYSPPDHHPRGPTCYHVAVKTGKVMGAGTDANVFLIIYGKNGRTTTHLLDNPNKNDFERDTISEFTIMDMDVGEIERIKIWHDNTGAGPAWLLDSVIIRKKHSTSRFVTNIFIQRLEQISKALYRQAREQLTKDSKRRATSSKENDRRTSKLKDDDDLGNARSILRSPIISDKANLQKQVRWNEQSLGFQDQPYPIDTKRMKNMQTTIEQKRNKEDVPPPIESGHFDHQAYWISTHNYTNKKWQIQSIEERNPLNLDDSTRQALLADRLAIDTKIKTPINEKDDDVYEFEANRWLDKDKNDGKIEVTLKPKSTKLSTQTSNEMKAKSSADKIDDSKKKHMPSSDYRQEKYDDEHSKRPSQFDLGPLEKPSRSLASLNRSPRDLSKIQLDDSRSSHRSQEKLSSTLKRQEESSIDKYHRPSSRMSNELKTSSTSDRELLEKSSHQPPYHSRSAATSVIDTRSSKSSADKIDDSKKKHMPSSDYRQEKYDDEYSKRAAQFDLGPLEKPSRSSASLNRSPHDLSKIQLDDSRSSHRSQENLSNTLKRQEESSIDKYHRPSSRMSNELKTSSNSDRELLETSSHQPPYHSRSAATSVIDTRSSKSSADKIDDSKKKHMPSSDYRQEKYDDEHSKRATQFDLGPLEKSSRSSASLNRSPHDLSKIQLDDSRSSHRSQENLSSTLKRQEESSIDKYHRPSSRMSNELKTSSTSERELLETSLHQPPYHSRSAATSVIDTRSSKSERFNTEPISPLIGNRDLSKLLTEPSYRPKSAARSTFDLPSNRTQRNQTYSSAYGTMPIED